MKADLGLMLAGLREAKGWSQQQLIVEGEVRTSRSSIANTETGRQFPDEKFWAECDHALEAQGELLAAYHEVAGAIVAQRQRESEAARHRLEEQRSSWLGLVRDGTIRHRNDHFPQGRARSTTEVVEIEHMVSRRTLLASLPLLTTAIAPNGVSVLESRVADLWRSYQRSQFQLVVSHLPALLASLQARRSETNLPEQHRYGQLLAMTYQLSATVLTKLGYTDQALDAVDHGIRAAQQSERPVVYASLSRSKAHTLMTAGFPSEAAALVDETIQELTRASLVDTPSAVSVLGTLHLVGAIAAAREQDRREAEVRLSAADSTAALLGRDSNQLWTSFGPTNVAIHRVVVSIELGSPDQAIELARQVNAGLMPIERRIRHAIETARAHTLCGQTDDALAVILEAEIHAPEQVRNHRLSRALVRQCLELSAPRPELHALAQRMDLELLAEDET